MGGPYEVIWETIDGKSHSTVFIYGDHALRHACDFCYKLREMGDVVSGHVYDVQGKKSFASFDKEDL